MSNDISMNIPSVSVDDFVDEMTRVYVPTIKAGYPINMIPAAMLCNSPVLERVMESENLQTGLERLRTRG